MFLHTSLIAKSLATVQCRVVSTRLLKILQKIIEGGIQKYTYSEVVQMSIEICESSMRLALIEIRELTP